MVMVSISLFDRNSSLSSQLKLFAQQLSQKDQQLASLQKELSLYQQLLGEKGSTSPLTRGKGSYIYYYVIYI